MTDDAGKVCGWEDVDTLGCCGRTTADACNGCDVASGCCDEFEFCVACCLRDDDTRGGKWKREAKTPGKESTGHWENPFDYCRGKCRTNAHSTIHENTYMSHSHHCFGDVAFPSPTPPPLAPLPSGMVAVAGAQGQSCTQTCAGQQKKCSAAGLKQLNSCDHLRAAFTCEAGCEASSGLDKPCYVSGPSLDTSAKCFTSTDSVLNCDIVGGSVRRLCACE